MKKFITVCLLVVHFGSWCQDVYAAELKAYGFGTADILRDDTRGRVYCAVPASNSVAVIDSDSLQVLATVFTGSQPGSLAVSPDGTKLYVANHGSTAQGIAVMDLDSLAVSKYIATTSAPTAVAVSAGTVYVLESDAIRAYDAASGAGLPGTLSTYSGGIFVYGGTLKISPDGNTLYYFQGGLSPSSWFRIGVTSWPGTNTQSGSFGSNGQGMCLSSNGQYITFVSGSPYYVAKLSAADPTVGSGVFNTGAYPRAATYSPDGNYLYTVHTAGLIDVWNANTYVALTSLTNVGQAMNLQCDRKGKVLFAGTSTDMRAYFVGTTNAGGAINVKIDHAVEIRWDSVAGYLYQVEWQSGIGAGTNWFSLGGQILGNGLTMSIYDTTRGSLLKLYRVRQVSP